MQKVSVEILNPEALKLLRDMQDLKLIKLNDIPPSSLKDYLENMRKDASSVPDTDELAEIVKEVRAERYAGK